MTENNTSMLTEIKLFSAIAIPTVLLQFSVYSVFSQIASSVGRNLGKNELAGYSLGSLCGNLLCLSIIIGSLTACETLLPRAYQLKQYNEVGIVTMRGYIVTFMMLMPIMILLFFKSEVILVHLGQDQDVSKLAANWIRIYLIGVPIVLFFRCFQRFLAAQNIVFPMVLGAFIGGIIIAPLIISTSISRFAFAGSGISLVIIQAIEIIIPLLYVKIKKTYHPSTWPGLCALLKDCFRVKPLKEFILLSTGGVSSYTEWWFWEFVCFIAGFMGLEAFCAHSIAYQLIPLSYMLPLGTSIGLCVRMGALLSKQDLKKAKLLALYTILFILFSGSLLSFIIYKERDRIIHLFTNDVIVQEGCVKIWPNVCIYIVGLYLYGINSGITRALGYQWRMAFIVFIVLWSVTAPTLYFFCIRGKSISIDDYGMSQLHTMWHILPFAYMMLNAALMINYMFFINWEKVSDSIIQKQMQSQSGNILNGVNENTRLVEESSQP